MYASTEKEECLENMGKSCLNMYHIVSYAQLVKVLNIYYPRNVKFILSYLQYVHLLYKNEGGTWNMVKMTGTWNIGSKNIWNMEHWV